MTEKEKMILVNVQQMRVTELYNAVIIFPKDEPRIKISVPMPDVFVPGLQFAFLRNMNKAFE